MSNKREKMSSGKYMISLHDWRSRVALIACIVTLFASLAMIGRGMVEYTTGGTDARVLFHYFTVNSNFLTAIASGTIIAYAVDGIRKKRFTYPKWTALLHYSGTVCTTLTMVFAIGLISWYDPRMAFGGTNLFLHLICPLLVLIAFFLVESDNNYTVRDTLIVLIPFAIYCVIYLYEVVIVGPEQGGWQDFYHFTDFVPIYVALPAMCLLAFGIATGIRLLSNRLNAVRRRKLRRRESTRMRQLYEAKRAARRTTLEDAAACSACWPRTRRVGNERSQWQSVGAQRNRSRGMSGLAKFA